MGTRHRTSWHRVRYAASGFRSESIKMSSRLHGLDSSSSSSHLSTSLPRLVTQSKGGEVDHANDAYSLLGPVLLPLALHADGGVRGVWGTRRHVQSGLQCSRFGSDA